MIEIIDRERFLEDTRKRFQQHKEIYSPNNIGRRVASLILGRNPKDLPRRERIKIGKIVGQFIREVEDMESFALLSYYQFDAMMCDINNKSSP